MWPRPLSEDEELNKIVIVAVVAACIICVGAAVVLLQDDNEGQKPETGEQTPETIATGFIEDMCAGRTNEGTDKFNSDMKKASGNIILAWKSTIGPLGTLNEISDMEISEYGDNVITESYCIFENGGKRIRVVLDQNDQIAGLFFYDYSPRDIDPVPDGLNERDIILNAGTRWELDGKITSSSNSDGKVAVVIVHGTGPNDMDLTFGMNKMYRDIAWGLAEQGVDVLRYDKRTHTYGAESAVVPEKLTVKDKTIDDAIAAAKFLKAEGYDKVFLIGHSLGGMLAPRIVSESNGAFDGFISMAGSPRTLAEISYDQSIAATKNPIELMAIELEKKKTVDMLGWDEAKSISTTVFGYSAYFQKEMAGKDAGTIAKSLDVPMLFLHGDKDWQVYVDKDFDKWKEILAGKPNVEFILYEGLNHMFAESKGDNVGTVAEYYPRNDVSNEVIEDMAEFILSNS